MPANARPRRQRLAAPAGTPAPAASATCVLLLMTAGSPSTLCAVLPGTATRRARRVPGDRRRGAARRGQTRPLCRIIGSQAPRPASARRHRDRVNPFNSWTRPPADPHGFSGLSFGTGPNRSGSLRHGADAAFASTAAPGVPGTSGAPLHPGPWLVPAPAGSAAGHGGGAAGCLASLLLPAVTRDAFPGARPVVA